MRVYLEQFFRCIPVNWHHMAVTIGHPEKYTNNLNQLINAIKSCSLSGKRKTSVIEIG